MSTNAAKRVITGAWRTKALNRLRQDMLRQMRWQRSYRIWRMKSLIFESLVCDNAIKMNTIYIYVVSCSFLELVKLRIGIGFGISYILEEICS